ncbi:metal-sensitive transcriptional regulator [Falsarthrobacter nasiphocae]|uniref:DNA-binding FrmR family transcriptional regulator n=1 Tax=Falsarthrobacter nasiphocae TaxID=189863 RepID=A0AAE4C5A5_9MICC|nr:metal-sensitive transcriptional regulator [Falsarthrobacter nasiphocae]MDR6892146.1 DNA-binding FrmR family transcriptional regulator [Falsarthrobacter nasiphocae]
MIPPHDTHPTAAPGPVESAEAPAPDAPGYSGDKKALLARLKRIEGQVRGIRRMIEEDEYCIDVLTQVNAADSALRGVSIKLLEKHVGHCVAHAEGQELDAKVEEVITTISRLVR